MNTMEIKLPSGKKAVLKEELTTGDVDDIQAVFLSSMKMKMVNGVPVNEADVDTSVTIKAKYVLFQKAVISVDGKTDLDEAFFRELSVRDGDALEKKVNEIQANSKLTPERKKK